MSKQEEYKLLKVVNAESNKISERFGLDKKGDDTVWEEAAERMGVAMTAILKEKAGSGRSV